MGCGKCGYCCLDCYFSVSKKDPKLDAVQQTMGSFGRWHVLICFFIFLVKFPVAWHQLSFVVLAPAASFECTKNGTSKCSAACPNHDFNRSHFKETLVTQWDLVCSKAYLANMVQTITMLGILVGNVLFGYWSDRNGRRIPMIVAVLLQAIAGVAQVFVPWFWAFLTLRFILNIATGGTMITSFVLVMELIGTKWRTAVATLYQLPFNMGHLSLAGLGYYIHDWRYIQISLSAPSFLLVSYYWILPESPRWLLTVGKTEKAIKVLEKAARHNGLPVENIKDDITKYQEQRVIAKSGGNMLDLVRTRRMCIKTFCIGYNWFVCGLCFYGVAQYVGLLSGDLFVNIAISAGIQIPGTIICVWALDKLGRKYTLFTANVIAGISCLCIPLVPDLFQPILASLSMFGLSICFPTVYMYSGELFPTVIRNVGVGTSSMFARYGAIIAPHISTLGQDTIPWVSPVIFGIIPIIGALLCFLLPETANCKLPDTLAEAEAFGVKPPKAEATEPAK